ncbi:UNVERIFIED_ORG: Na+/alanine symporter [Arthrobacter sp. UYEF2]
MASDIPCKRLRKLAFMAITLIFFCLTTVFAYYYMAETNLRFLGATPRASSFRASR